MKSKKTSVWQAIVEQDEAGWYVAECPALRACCTRGRISEEAIENITDVIALCRADLRANGEEIPEQSEIIGVRLVEVTAGVGSGPSSHGS